MPILLDLFLTFAKVGVMTFGGGYAMLPILQREVVENKGWATEEELMDYFAIGQCTPGIIAVNTATFIGFKRKGILGGIFATLGVVTPSVIIITLLASVLQLIAGNKIANSAFAGISVAVCALVIQAILKLIKSGIKDALTLGIAIAAFFAMFVLDASPILVILICAVVGVTAKRVLEKHSTKGVK